VKEAEVSAYPFPTVNCLAFVAYSGAIRASYMCDIMHLRSHEVVPLNERD
jgi:hypothetical protein